jgi:hypothetical protein
MALTDVTGVEVDSGGRAVGGSGTGRRGNHAALTFGGYR